MKPKEGKRHLLGAGQVYESLWVKIGKVRIWEKKNNKKPLELIINRNLNLDDNTF